MLAEPIAVTTMVTDTLDALGVTYAIGGSLASAVHGVMRATMDADLVADLRMEHVELLAQALGDAFYTDVEMMRDAIRRHSSFNLIHLETMFKVALTLPAPKTLCSPNWSGTAWAVVFLTASGVTCWACSRSKVSGLTVATCARWLPPWPWMICSNEPLTRPTDRRDCK